MAKATENTNLNDRINEFVQKNRTPIFVFIGLIVLALAVFITSITLIGENRKRGTIAVEELFSRYETLRPFIGDESSAGDLDGLMKELETLAKKTRGYPGGRAWAIIAAIYGEKNEWAEAENAWAGAAKTAQKTNLEPIAWFNAAVAAEEQGKNDQALEYYEKSLAVKSAFPAAVQAQFSVGRLRESGGDREGAIEAYRALISGWSYDTIWTNLAHSRIAALEAKKLIETND
jgi:tetratricopeptide (TPR) repeat protein